MAHTTKVAASTTAASAPASTTTAVKQKPSLKLLLSKLLPTSKELWAAIKSTEWRVDDRILEIKSWRLFVGALIITVSCLISFKLIVECLLVPFSLANGYTGDKTDLQILDLRNGYTLSDVSTLFGRWGQQGRLAYVLIEVIDLLFYHVGYRLAAIVVLNRLVASCKVKYPTHAPYLEYIPRLPLYLAKIDLLEDVFQVLLVCIYEWHSDSQNTLDTLMKQGYFGRLVKISSGLNRLKWLVCRSGCLLFMYLFTINRVASNMQKNSPQLAKESDQKKKD